MAAVLNSQSNHLSDSLKTLEITQESRVIIVGLGVTGHSVLHFLLQRGIVPTIVDSRSRPPILDQLQENKQQQYRKVEIKTGSDAFDRLDQATHLIVSPGVALNTPQIVAAKEAGARILSDIDLFAIEATAPVIAITGSNGKTTVTTLVGKMIENAGKTVAVGGNIGTPVLNLLQKPEPEFYVLELSSFQLENVSKLQPAAAVVLNLSSDHMDRYDDILDYARAKANIYSKANIIIENFLDAISSYDSSLENNTNNKLYFGLTENEGCHFRLATINDETWLVVNDQHLMPVSKVAMRGRHNIANALAALALVSAVSVSPISAVPVLSKFSGLPHRMELVCERSGVLWINDSKATNVGACQAALQSMDNEVILIAGGDGKGADFSELALNIVDKVNELILLGKDADLLQSVFNNLANIHRVDSIDEAVILAAEISRPGDTVLLSPACASLDQFKDYQARGDAFKNAVMRLPV